MARTNTKIGDIFCAQIDSKTKKYFQYIANDLTQLNSDVIRVFNTKYSVEQQPELSDIIKDDVDFYAHCVTKIGLKLNFWQYIGNMGDVGEKNVLFRTSGDRADVGKNASRDWYVWRIGEDFKRVGILEGENRKAEIGGVIPPDSIIYRMLHGEYDFVYPNFE
ncbi:hypothetical protein FMM05_13135 [Flavobacterium zepuense]|uniref:Uncharacterized protein n=1 Tax=Flavobacterium zepuense TaxID=2593302 RepID=A0A552UZG2_9FLAO|nr:hypothetical protein [Flavobacterium zepuense]TRW23599.1 hypothetical protein FMM05_13135 [Flavobacterium zepuense]